MKLIKYIIVGHGDNILQGKHDGIVGKRINNNKGVSRGIAISPLLHSTFSDGIKGDCREDLNKIRISEIRMGVKNLSVEFDWGYYIVEI